jgi:hypothetical protein
VSIVWQNLSENRELHEPGGPIPMEAVGRARLL